MDLLQCCEHFSKLGRIVHFPVLLRSKANAGAVGTPTLVTATEGRSGSPGRGDEFTSGQTGVEDFSLELGNVLLVHHFMIHGWQRVLPNQHFLWHFRAKVTRKRAHVAVSQLEPSFGKGLRKFSRVFQETLRDLVVARVFTQRHVRGEHDGRMRFPCNMGVWNEAIPRTALRRPLLGTRRAFGQLPFEREEVGEVTVRPSARRGCPRTFETTGDGVFGIAFPELVFPTQAHLFQRRGFRLRADVFRISGTVSFSKGMTTGDERDGFLVIHGHAGKSLADVLGGSQRVGFTVRTFRIDIDQTHLHGGKRLIELALVLVAFVAQPGAFRSPVDVFLRLPDIGTATGKTEGLEAHGFEGHVTSEDH